MPRHETVHAALRLPGRRVQRPHPAAPASADDKPTGTPPTYVRAVNGAPASADSRQAPSARRTNAVERDLLKFFLRETGHRRIAMPVLTVAMVALCWDLAELGALLAWFFAGIALITLKWRFERRHAHEGAFDDPAARRRFVQEMRPIYTLSGALWGSSVLLHASQPLGVNLFSCALILACVAALPLMGSASVPALARTFMHSLFATFIACLVAVTWGHSNSVERLNAGLNLKNQSGWVFVLVPFYYWWLLRSLARRIYVVQRAQFELQYDMAGREKQARDLAEAKCRFVSAAAHDLRQPTMALSIYAQQLVECPEDHLALAPRIARASTAVRHLFDSLFDLAHLDSGNVKLRIEPVRVKALLEELHDQFEATAKAKSIELTVQSADAVIETDPVRLRRMIANVVSNAIKYSPAHTRVRIVARATNGTVRIRVSDQGLGIPAADLEKVFDEFYRVDHQEALSEDGVGLGLSIVNRLAQLLRCQIELQSEVGKGTHFAFVLQSRFDTSLAQGPSMNVG
ncbi:MAG: HAMP domain-containing histidine kinase [Gammaproteobacteria bacterium]|nr:HAMP domain-containing histidine kinase [Gammaproteobacteria bacterium]